MQLKPKLYQLAVWLIVQMTVVNNWICGKLRKTIGIEGFNETTVQILYQSICLNTNGNIYLKVST